MEITKVFFFEESELCGFCAEISLTSEAFASKRSRSGKLEPKTANVHRRWKQEQHEPLACTYNGFSSPCSYPALQTLACVGTSDRRSVPTSVAQTSDPFTNISSTTTVGCFTTTTWTYLLAKSTPTGTLSVSTLRSFKITIPTIRATLFS